MGAPAQKHQARCLASLLPLRRHGLLAVFPALLLPSKLLNDYVLRACKAAEGNVGLGTTFWASSTFTPFLWSQKSDPFSASNSDLPPLGSYPPNPIDRPLWLVSLPSLPNLPQVPYPPTQSAGGEIRMKGGEAGRDRRMKDGRRGRGEGKRKMAGLRGKDSEKSRGWRASEKH